MLRSRRLGSNPFVANASENSPAFRFGDKNDGVAILQDLLVDLGFPMPITTGNGQIFADGIYGAETTATVKKFQLREGLAADGVAGRMTLQRLDEIVLTTPHLETKDPFVEQAKLTAEMQSPTSPPFSIT